MGGNWRTKPEMIAFTDEALQIMRSALAGGPVEFRGDQLTVGYEAGPLPPAPVPLWLGSQGPRMLDLTGRRSDGWVTPLSTYTPPSAVPAMQQRIDEAARRRPVATPRSCAASTTWSAASARFDAGPGSPATSRGGSTRSPAGPSTLASTRSFCGR